MDNKVDSSFGIIGVVFLSFVVMTIRITFCSSPGSSPSRLSWSFDWDLQLPVRFVVAVFLVLSDKNTFKSQKLKNIFLITLFEMNLKTLKVFQDNHVEKFWF